MIGRLSGEVIECTPGEVLLDVQGVGYELHIPLGTFYDLSRSSGQRATLYVHTHVREDALVLFGFSTRDERRSFETLLGINGVGPRLALAVISGIGAHELVRAVETQDRARLQKIPGVGKKTAERMLLELRDRLDAPSAPASAAPGHASAAGAAASGDAREDALSALTNLGYGLEAAARAIDRAREELGEDSELEPLLKAALTRMVG